MRHSGSGSRGRCDSASPEAVQMRQQARAQVEIRDVAAGLWLWRTEHPHWRPGVDWELVVASTCVESGGEVLLLDPLAPPDDAPAGGGGVGGAPGGGGGGRGVPPQPARAPRDGPGGGGRLDARRPTAVVVLKPDH